MRLLTDAELQKVLARSQKGITIAQISRELKIKKASLIIQMRDHNIPSAQFFKRLKKKKKIIKLIKAGLTNEELSRELQISVGSIGSFRRSNGIFLKVKKKPGVKRKRDIHLSWRDRVAAGEKVKAIADEFGLTVAAIQMAIKRLEE